MPSPATIEHAWTDLRSTSKTSHQSVLDVSMAMALSAQRSVAGHLQRLSQAVAIAARTAGMVVGGVFLEHCAAASKQIAATGFEPYWARHSRPYLAGGDPQLSAGKAHLVRTAANKIAAAGIALTK